MVAAATKHLLPGKGERKLTPEEQAEIEDVLDAAQMWAEGKLDVPGAATVGALPYNGTTSPGYSRFVAVRLTPKSDPRRAALLKLVNHLDRMMGTVHTTQGTYERAELAESDVAVKWQRLRNEDRNVA